TYLRREVLPNAAGEGRLGRERFDARLARTFSDPSVTSDAILAEAEEQFDLVRREMVRLARDLWPAFRAGETMPADAGQLVEAVPGHSRQGVYANRVESPVRSVFGDGVFAEGWAVYVTHVMLDLGFGADDPALWLMHWKYYLRAIVNAIIDVRIHVHGMTRDD